MFLLGMRAKEKPDKVFDIYCIYSRYNPESQKSGAPPTGVGGTTYFSYDIRRRRIKSDL